VLRVLCGQSCKRHRDSCTFLCCELAARRECTLIVCSFAIQVWRFQSATSQHSGSRPPLCPSFRFVLFFILVFPFRLWSSMPSACSLLRLLAQHGFYSLKSCLGVTNSFPFLLDDLADLHKKTASFLGGALLLLCELVAPVKALQ
jgi:hypothetical protein